MNVLIVDDNPAEAQLTREAFVESCGDFNLTHVACGEDALDFLKHENGFSNAIRPDLVLLDLNLPGKNGCEVLREIKGDQRLMTIPVVVISNSDHPDDIERVFGISGDGYLVKPGNIDDFFEMIKQLVDNWGPIEEPSSRN